MALNKSVLAVLLVFFISEPNDLYRSANMHSGVLFPGERREREVSDTWVGVLMVP